MLLMVTRPCPVKTCSSKRDDRSQSQDAIHRRNTRSSSQGSRHCESTLMANPLNTVLVSLMVCCPQKLVPEKQAMEEITKRMQVRSSTSDCRVNQWAAGWLENAERGMSDLPLPAGGEGWHQVLWPMQPRGAHSWIAPCRSVCLGRCSRSHRRMTAT